MQNDNFIYHTPRYKTITDINGLKEITESGKIALMCPECFHMIEADINYTKSIYLDDKVPDLFASNSYYGECPECHTSNEFIQIDINMAQIINILNRKGYYTAYCCEGHLEPADDCSGNIEFTCPYVYFYIWEITYDLRAFQLPDTWFIDDLDWECKVFTIYDKVGCYVKRFSEFMENKELIKTIERIWDKEQSLRDLYNWALSLPVNINSENHYQYIKKYGKQIILNNAERISLYGMM